MTILIKPAVKVISAEACCLCITDNDTGIGIIKKTGRGGEGDFDREVMTSCTEAAHK